MLFSGRDIWRNGAFAYGGFIHAPGGLDQDGLLLKLLLSGGRYSYDAANLGGARVTGTEWRCTKSTGIPFDSLVWTIGGKSSAASWPTGGSGRLPLTAPSLLSAPAFGGSTALASWYAGRSPGESVIVSAGRVIQRCIAVRTMAGVIEA